MNIKDYIRDVPDFPKPGIVFRDITPLLHCAEAYRYTIEQLRNVAYNVDIVAGIESRGFLLASAIAYDLAKPLVIVRKPGKLPHTTYKSAYDLEYGSAELHVHQDIPKGNVFLVDDVLATGGTIGAAISVLREAGCNVSVCAFLMELSFLRGRDKIKDHNVFSLVQYEE